MSIDPQTETMLVRLFFQKCRSTTAKERPGSDAFELSGGSLSVEYEADIALRIEFRNVGFPTFGLPASSSRR